MLPWNLPGRFPFWSAESKSCVVFQSPALEISPARLRWAAGTSPSSEPFRIPKFQNASNFSPSQSLWVLCFLIYSSYFVGHTGAVKNKALCQSISKNLFLLDRRNKQRKLHVSPPNCRPCSSRSGDKTTFFKCLDMYLDVCSRLFKFKYFGHGFSASLFIF